MQSFETNDRRHWPRPCISSLPRISIVTPSFNQGHFIRWCVRSVLLQEYPNLEYLVLDGGSTDGTQEVVAPYRNRLAYWCSAPDAGQADAVAQGFERSSGEVMAYLNSDDMLAPGALQFVGRYFAEHPQVDAIYSHRCIVDENNRVRSYWVLPEHRNYLMRRWDMIPQETCFWRRRLFEQCGNVNRSLQFALDYDLFLRFMSTGTFVRVDRFLAAFRKHQQAKTLRLLSTSGREEIRRVRAARGVRISAAEKAVGALFFRWVVARGWWHATTHRSRPGALPGVGYDYDGVWGARLNSGQTGERS
jgi:glycosyltransferase involved in cell wall biosynthesis